MTPKQIKMVKGIKENLRVKGSSKSLGKIAKEAGYSDKMSLQPSNILKAPEIQDELQSLLKRISSARSDSLKQVSPDKLEKLNAKDNAYIFDLLTKNHRLLDNKATETRELRIDISEDILSKNL